MNVRYLEERRGVTDFSPLISLECCSIQWIPPFPLCPFYLGVRSVPRAPSPSPFSHRICGTFLASRGACSCRGRQFANSPHSDMIDNRKPRCFLIFFEVLVPPPTCHENE